MSLKVFNIFILSSPSHALPSFHISFVSPQPSHLRGRGPLLRAGVGSPTACEPPMPWPASAMCRNRTSKEVCPRLCKLWFHATVDGCGMVVPSCWWPCGPNTFVLFLHVKKQKIKKIKIKCFFSQTFSARSQIFSIFRALNPFAVWQNDSNAPNTNQCLQFWCDPLVIEPGDVHNEGL